VAKRTFFAFAGVAVLVTALPIPAATVAKKGTVGILEVEYEMTSQGSRKRENDQAEWHGKRILTIAFEVVAGEVQARPITLVGVPKGKNSFAARKDTKAKENAASQKSLDAAVKACKQDAACKTRVTLEYMSSDAGAKAIADTRAFGSEAAGKDGPPRYQFWSPVGVKGKPRAVSGAYVVDQYVKTESYDPLCGKTKNICTEIRAIKGSGPLTAEALQFFDWTLGMEGMLSGGIILDTQDSTLTVGIPHPNALIEIVETVDETAGGKHATKKKEPWLAQAQKWDDGLGVADLACPDPLRELRGEITKKVFNGYAPTMTIRWHFAVKP
jgi:hypothetical protein